MNPTVSWTFALGVALALAGGSFAGALAAHHRANAECAAPDAVPWCGMGEETLRVLLLFAGLGFLLMAGVCALAAAKARQAREAAGGA